MLHIHLISSHQTCIQNDIAVPSTIEKYTNFSILLDHRWVLHTLVSVRDTGQTSSFSSSSFISVFFPQIFWIIVISSHQFTLHFMSHINLMNFHLEICVFLLLKKGPFRKRIFKTNILD